MIESAQKMYGKATSDVRDGETVVVTIKQDGTLEVRSFLVSDLPTDQQKVQLRTEGQQ